MTEGALFIYFLQQLSAVNSIFLSGGHLSTSLKPARLTGDLLLSVACSPSIGMVVTSDIKCYCCVPTPCTATPLILRARLQSIQQLVDNDSSARTPPSDSIDRLQTTATILESINAVIVTLIKIHIHILLCIPVKDFAAMMQHLDVNGLGRTFFTHKNVLESIHTWVRTAHHHCDSIYVTCLCAAWLLGTWWHVFVCVSVSALWKTELSG